MKIHPDTPIVDMRSRMSTRLFHALCAYFPGEWLNRPDGMAKDLFNIDRMNFLGFRNVGRGTLRELDSLLEKIENVKPEEPQETMKVLIVVQSKGRGIELDVPVKMIDEIRNFLNEINHQ